MLFDLEVKLFGVNGGYYLLFNFIIHVLLSMLLILVLSGLALPRETSFLSGGLFVLGFGHYGKQVMWACTSGPLTSMLVVTLSVLLALKYAQKPGKIYLAATIVTAALAPAFHEIGLTAPVLVIAVWWMLGVSRKGKWALISLAGVVLIGWFLLYAAVSGSYESYGAAASVPRQLPGLFVRYLGFMAVPIQQSDIIGRHPSLFGLILRASGSAQLALGILIIAAASLVFFGSGRNYKFIVIWLFVALMPFCFIRLPENWLELRYAYFAAMPYCALFAVAAAKAIAKFERRIGIAVVVLMLAAAGMTVYVVRALEDQYDKQTKSAVNEQRMEDTRRMLSVP